jgi:hypothetical protein
VFGNLGESQIKRLVTQAWRDRKLIYTQRDGLGENVISMQFRSKGQYGKTEFDIEFYYHPDKNLVNTAFSPGAGR